MALIVEDGTGLPDAESYASVVEADAYFAARGQADAWDAVEDKEVALRLAADYLSYTYRNLWAGDRLDSLQALDWPRVEVPWDTPTGYRDYRVIPRELKNAQCELALRTAAGSLIADLGRETKRETVDVITVEYADNGSRQTEYSIVDGWLKSLLGVGAGSGSVKVHRA